MEIDPPTEIEEREAREGVRKQQRIKLAFGLNTSLALALMCALVVMVNYLSYRHFKRRDFSRTQYYTLSEKTTGLLAGLTGKVEVIVFFQPGQDVYEDIRNLLREYEYESPMVDVEYVDPDRDLARTEEMAAKYEVTEANVVVFDVGGRSKYVTSADIAEYDYAPMRYGQAPRQLDFRGEQAFSSAIQSITQTRKPVVYFLSGHGEGDIESYDRRIGFSGIAREVHRDNIDARKLVLGAAANIPGDCDALIVAGPQKRPSKPELEIIGDYLEQNGRLLFLVDAGVETGFGALLEKWGARLGDDLVVDATRTLTGMELFITTYGVHPITEKLDGITSILYLPRSVEPITDHEEQADPADKPRVTVLASCSESGWAETESNKEGAFSFDVGVDRPGPVPVVVAIEKGPVPGIDVQIRPTRLVIFGDSDFVSNGAMTAGDTDFFMSALNWLLEREELMGISPRDLQQVRLILGARQISMLFWSVVFGMPGLMALLGIAVWYRRRS